MSPFYLFQARRTPVFLVNSNTSDVLRTLRYILRYIHTEDISSEPPNGGRNFPYQINFPNNLTATDCLELCAAFGYPAAGMEFGNQCCKYSTVANHPLIPC